MRLSFRWPVINCFYLVNSFVSLLPVHEHQSISRSRSIAAQSFKLEILLSSWLRVWHSVWCVYGMWNKNAASNHHKYNNLIIKYFNNYVVAIDVHSWRCVCVSIARIIHSTRFNYYGFAKAFVVFFILFYLLYRCARCVQRGRENKAVLHSEMARYEEEKIMDRIIEIVF